MENQSVIFTTTAYSNRKAYSAEEKLSACRRYEAEGGTIKSFAQRLRIPTSTFYCWWLRYKGIPRGGMALAKAGMACPAPDADPPEPLDVTAMAASLGLAPPQGMVRFRVNGFEVETDAAGVRCFLEAMARC